MSISLTKLAKKHGTDKGPMKHYYTRSYDSIFARMRNDKIKILEIGVADGASIKMWLDYFPNATIYGLDILDLKPKALGIKDKRFKFIRGSQADEAVLDSILKECPEFDIIIDDGSHRPEDQQFTLTKMYPSIKVRGYYVIEDLNFLCESETPKTVNLIQKFMETGEFYDEYVQEYTTKTDLVCSDKLAFFLKKKAKRYEVPQFDAPNLSLLLAYDIDVKYKDFESIPIQVTTTATMRPALVERTFASFVKNLKGVDWQKSTLFINIDPIPEGDRRKVAKVCNKFFGNVVANYPRKSSYSEAFNWAWDQATDEYILNLEDDWILVQPIHIAELLDVFVQVPTLYQVVLRAYGYVYPSCVTSPAILHERFYKLIAGKLDPNRNPENQIHCRGDEFGLKDIPFKRKKVNPGTRVLAYPTDGNSRIVRDIGREWMDSTDLCRPEGKASFTTWQKKSISDQPVNPVYSPTILAGEEGCDV